MSKPIDRRNALISGSRTLAALAGAWLAGPALLRVALGAVAEDQPNDLMVVVFLRGGADGLNLAPPIAGPDRAIYEAERPQLQVPNTGAQAALKLNESLGLHPAAQGLYDLYREKKLALVHACGLPSDTRSHFDAQNYMELGTPDHKATQDGWITRYLKSRHIENSVKLQAVSIGNLVPISLLGYSEAAILSGLKNFQIGGNKKFVDAELAAIQQMYSGGNPPWLARYGTETLEAMHLLANVPQSDYSAANGAAYPKEDLGNRLKILAQLVRLNVGVRVATIDMGGWDTHKYQGNGSEGFFAKQVGQLSDAVSAFHKDLDGNFTMVIMTEFGRRLKENANHGTDHGHGGVMMALGNHVKGGKVYGKWPGLKTEQLYERADLAVATDYRQVLCELLAKKYGVKQLSTIFPNYAKPQHLGLFA